MKQREMALWLRILVVFTGVALLSFFAVFAPLLAARLAAQNPAAYSYLLSPGILFVGTALVPAFVGLWKAWAICGQIAANNSFSKQNAGLLRDISRLCMVDALIFLLGAVWMVATGHRDVFVLLLLFTFSFIAIFLAVATAALSHLTEKASQLKQENDLTI